jgi:four helix bundle protein
MYQFPFEKLEIWNLSIELSLKIYLATKKFPDDEKFAITSQLRRAANSVSANIAEGASRFGNKDKVRFFQISYSSLMEVLNFLVISEKLNYISNEELSEFRLSIGELSNKINAYHKKLT